MARSRHPQILRMKMGVKRDGTVIASQLTVLATTGAYGSHSTTVQGNTGSKVLPLYRAPNMRFECHVVYTNAPVAGAFRGYGCPQGFFAQETVVDEIADELGIDPLEFHRRNVIRLGDIDRLSAQLGEGREGLPRVIRSCGLPECMDARRRRHRLERKAAMPPPTPSHLKRGVGMACTMQGSGIAGIDWASAFLKMNEDGSFFLQVGASDVGAGADTVLSQIAAETLGVTLDKIAHHLRRYRLHPLRRRRLRFQHHHHLRRRGEESRPKRSAPRSSSWRRRCSIRPPISWTARNNEVFTLCGCRKSRHHDRDRDAGHV